VEEASFLVDLAHDGQYSAPTADETS
jgi:hypothetical protein